MKSDSEEWDSQEENIQDLELESEPEKTESSKNADRQSRLEQKSLQRERKMAKPHADIVQQAKKLWEQLRRKSLEPEKRKKIALELHTLIKGRVSDVVFKHDASRIVQCLLKHGSDTIRQEVAVELRSHHLDLAKSHYGRFILTKLIRFCAADRPLILKAFYGKVTKLMRHREAADLVEEMYAQYANSAQRLSLIQEFYGPEFAIFKEPIALDKLLAEKPEKRPSVLKHMKEALNSILEKGGAVIGAYSIIHRVALEYLTNLNPELENERQQMTQMMESLREHLPSILHTRDGAKVVQLCITYANAKDRKTILRSFKGYVHKIAVEAFGFTVLLSCFDCVDDTVLLKKTIVDELLEDYHDKEAGQHSTLAQLCRNPNGQRCILYLLCGRNSKYLPPFAVKELEELDVIRQKTSKKDDAIRRKELLVMAVNGLTKHVPNKMGELIRDRLSCQILFELVQKTDNKEPLFSSILQLVLEESSKQEESSEGPMNVVKKLKMEADTAKLSQEVPDMHLHVLTHRTSTQFIKNLIKERSEGQSEFANYFLSKLPQEKIHEWILHAMKKGSQGSGTGLIFVALLELEIESIQKILLLATQSHLTEYSKLRKEETMDTKKRKQPSEDKILIVDLLLKKLTELTVEKPLK